MTRVWTRTVAGGGDHRPVSLLRLTQFIGLVISVVGVLIASPSAVRHWIQRGRDTAHLAATAARRALLKAMWWRRKDVGLRGVAVLQGTTGVAPRSAHSQAGGGPR